MTAVRLDGLIEFGLDLGDRFTLKLSEHALVDHLVEVLHRRKVPLVVNGDSLGRWLLLHGRVLTHQVVIGSKGLERCLLMLS